MQAPKSSDAPRGHMADKGKTTVLGGKLKLKGDAPKKKKRKHREREDLGGDSDGDDVELPAHSADPVPGVGKLTTSGVVVMGHETQFDTQLEVGDSLLVTISDRYRNTQTDEQRTVNMVLGKTSLNVTAPFSCEVTTPTSFLLLKAAPDIEAIRAARRDEKRRARQAEEEASVVTYKTYKHGGGGTWKTWQTVTERVEAGTTREDMLIRRQKEKADRHCK